ncbi:P-loop NTPase family protein [Paenibacillus sp. CMAA1364]
MIPIRVVLAVQECDYIELLLRYVHSSEYADKLTINSFTSVDTFMEYMNGNEGKDVIIAEEVFLTPWLQTGEQSVTWVILHERGQSSLEGPVLAKYQPIPQLLDSILQFTRRKGIVTRSQNFGEMEMVGILSAVGGSGKTTTALNIAKQLGASGRSVFYLNLETMNSSAVFPSQIRHGERGAGLSRLLYELKAAQEKKDYSSISIASYVVHHEGIKADIFEPLLNIKEWMQMSKNDVCQLMQLIADSGQYDVMIVDTDSIAEERCEAVMEMCGILIWILLDDIISMHKSGQWLSYIERSNQSGYRDMMLKSKFIMNRYVGTLVNKLPSHVEHVDEFLPYIPSWKQVNHEEILLSSPIFQRDILNLCRSIVSDQQLVTLGGLAHG